MLFHALSCGWGLRINTLLVYPDETSSMFSFGYGVHLCAMQDVVEGARTAATNQEIKRVLTEVLLKVLLLNLTYMFSKLDNHS